MSYFRIILSIIFCNYAKRMQMLRLKVDISGKDIKIDKSYIPVFNEESI
jgi:hypothetical protein